VSPLSLRVLLIDDNVDSCEVLRLALEDAGHSVDEAHDGQLGLEMALQTRPDVAIVDIGLPTLDGYGIARELRARLGGDRPVLVALSGYGRREDIEQTRDAGFDRHLVKPIDLATLESVLSELGPRATSE
jgi:CheY-like chemotaxis protein